MWEMSYVSRRREKCQRNGLSHSNQIEVHRYRIAIEPYRVTSPLTVFVDKCVRKA